jgi:hypothetical protein
MYEKELTVDKVKTLFSIMFYLFACVVILEHENKGLFKAINL